MSSVFGNIFVPQTIEALTKTLLQTWFPTFIEEICDQQSIDPTTIKIPLATNYTSRNKFEALSGDDTPLVVVISPGLIGSPKKSGNGQYRATWRIGIGIATAAESEELAKLHSDIYGASAREIMLKKGGAALGGRIEWLDEQNTDLPIASQLQQFRAVSTWFSVDIENVATKRGGPAEPDAEPYAYPVANTVNIQLTKEA